MSTVELGIYDSVEPKGVTDKLFGWIAGFFLKKRRWPPQGLYVYVYIDLGYINIHVYFFLYGYGFIICIMSVYGGRQEWRELSISGVKIILSE